MTHSLSVRHFGHVLQVSQSSCIRWWVLKEKVVRYVHQHELFEYRVWIFNVTCLY